MNSLLFAVDLLSLLVVVIVFTRRQRAAEAALLYASAQTALAYFQLSGALNFVLLVFFAYLLVYWAVVFAGLKRYLGTVLPLFVGIVVGELFGQTLWLYIVKYVY
ncbi:MAG: hypothetical protein ACPGSC_11595 [Granulosicoccaceae bacterium]